MDKPFGRYIIIFLCWSTYFSIGCEFRWNYFRIFCLLRLNYLELISESLLFTALKWSWFSSRHLQNWRLRPSCSFVGTPQEPSRHELRQAKPIHPSVLQERHHEEDCSLAAFGVPILSAVRPIKRSRKHEKKTTPSIYSPCWWKISILVWGPLLSLLADSFTVYWAVMLEMRRWEWILTLGYRNRLVLSDIAHVRRTCHHPFRHWNVTHHKCRQIFCFSLGLTILCLHVQLLSALACFILLVLFIHLLPWFWVL